MPVILSGVKNLVYVCHSERSEESQDPSLAQKAGQDDGNNTIGVTLNAVKSPRDPSFNSG